MHVGYFDCDVGAGVEGTYFLEDWFSLRVQMLCFLLSEGLN